MMILRSSPASPFGRKVRIAASLLGLASEIEVTETDLDNPADSVRAQNPVGKIPVLIAEDGVAYYDSRVILEYLDYRAGGGRIVPREAPARFDALRLQALCDGILDACILLVYENRYRPVDKHVQLWIDRQNEKVARGMMVLESAPPKLDPLPDVGQITLACLLGYRDLRFAGTWRKDYPRLVAWHDKFAAQVPAFGETKIGLN
ncbi:MAG: glutathione S-transferase family protein [Pseudolabrys sp.]